MTDREVDVNPLCSVEDIIDGYIKNSDLDFHPMRQDPPARPVEDTDDVEPELTPPDGVSGGPVYDPRDVNRPYQDFGSIKRTLRDAEIEDTIRVQIGFQEHKEEFDVKLLANERRYPPVSGEYNWAVAFVPQDSEDGDYRRHHYTGIGNLDLPKWAVFSEAYNEPEDAIVDGTLAMTGFLVDAWEPI